MACDICGKVGTRLVDLRDEYQTADIKQICDECERTVNNHLGKIRIMNGKITQSWLKQFMVAMGLKNNKLA